MNKTIEAVLILTGMIIGVGMFGIPFSFSVSGFWLGAAELVVLAAIVTVIHRLYGEIVLATPTLHRVPGYVREYLGHCQIFNNFRQFRRTPCLSLGGFFIFTKHLLANTSRDVRVWLDHNTGSGRRFYY